MAKEPTSFEILTDFPPRRQIDPNSADLVTHSGLTMLTTEQGELGGVLLSATAYRELMARIEEAEIVAGIASGIEAARAGRVYDASEARRILSERIGLNLSR